MASIEAMTKEALRSLRIRVGRQDSANVERDAARAAKIRVEARLASAESKAEALDTEVTEKADLAARLTGRSVDDILNEIYAELDAEKPADESGDTDETPAADDAPAPKTSKAKGKGPVAPTDAPASV